MKSSNTAFSPGAPCSSAFPTTTLSTVLNRLVPLNQKSQLSLQQEVLAYTRRIPIPEKRSSEFLKPLHLPEKCCHHFHYCADEAAPSPNILYTSKQRTTGFVSLFSVWYVMERVEGVDSTSHVV